MTWLSAQQFAGFQRAASRRSRGQVTIPDVRLSLAEASALWTDIHAAFGPATGRDLAPQELGHLRRRAWRRSAGFASLSAPALSLEAAHAFWRLAGKLGALAARRKASPRSKVAGAAVLGLAATQMAACTTFLGSNIKGSYPALMRSCFSCLVLAAISLAPLPLLLSIYYRTHQLVPCE